MQYLLKQMNNEINIQNEEINKIKAKYNMDNSLYFSELKEFYRLRNERVLIARIKINDESKEYHKTLNSYDKVYSEIIYERDVNEDIYSVLMDWDLNFEESGTYYLYKLIRLLYDEVELYNSIDEDKFEYWDLDDFSNIHYKFIKGKSDKVIYEIIKSINNCPSTYGKKISNLVYDAVDSVMNYRTFDKNHYYYKKMNQK
ncbi:MAG: hypothetical protein IJI49_03505 [Bacilli bacterium]|nr:hypothetical protein [Bacilli bacterium]